MLFSQSVREDSWKIKREIGELARKTASTFKPNHEIEAGREIEEFCHSNNENLKKAADWFDCTMFSLFY